MIKKLIVLGSLVISLSASADTLDLGDHGVLSVTVPKDWQFLNKPVPGKGYAVALRPEAGTNAGASLSIIYVAGAQKIDPEKLRADLLRQCDEFIGVSVEKKKNIKTFAISKGYGEYCVFTDENLVGKPAKPGEFKVIAPGVVQLAPDVLIAVTLGADDAAGADFKALIDAVGSLDIQKTK